MSHSFPKNVNLTCMQEIDQMLNISLGTQASNNDLTATVTAMMLNNLVSCVGFIGLDHLQYEVRLHLHI